MTALSTREALAKALRDHAWRGNPTICRCGWDSPGLGRTTGESHAEHVAEALPVVDAATLADDEALAYWAARWLYAAYDDDPDVAWEDAPEPVRHSWGCDGRAALQALAAVLAERGERP